MIHAPLDGSALVDVNLAVGTIVSIYSGSNRLQPEMLDQGAPIFI